MTLLSKNLLPITLVLAGSVALAACSSKPSPWSESSSPWEGRAEQGAEPEPLAIDEIQPAYQQDETIEPVGFIAAEESSMMVESDAVMDEPMAEPVMMAEPAAVAVSGSLAEQPASMFAVQVVASSTMDQLSSFARQNNLSQEWVAETSVDGKVWFVLMSGVYSTKAEAEQALDGLQGLGTQPWIRTVGSIQAVMSR
ncbi:MAG: SPOR domain-containing protein [Gammaproteobacteria bacterium]|nr:SPOR domain-containing protein [Gammaproteobacteria bacterium]